MQADAEHQQDDANFRKLRRKALICNETRRMRTDENACDKISDKWWQAQAIGYRTEDKRQHEPPDDRRNQRRIVWHRSLPIWKSRSEYDIYDLY
jgi:hypothetical protein